MNLLTFWSCIIWSYAYGVYFYFKINQFSYFKRLTSQQTFVGVVLFEYNKMTQFLKNNWLQTRQGILRKIFFVSPVIYSLVYACTVIISSNRQSLIDWIYMYGLLFHYLGICSLLDRTQCLLKGSCFVKNLDGWILMNTNPIDTWNMAYWKSWNQQVWK